MEKKPFPITKVSFHFYEANSRIVEEFSKNLPLCPNMDADIADPFEEKGDAMIVWGNSFGILNRSKEEKLNKLFGNKLFDQIQEKIKEEFFGELLIGQTILIQPKFNESFPIKYLIYTSLFRSINLIENNCVFLAFRGVLIRIIKHNESCLKNGQDPIKSILFHSPWVNGQLKSNVISKQVFEAYRVVANKPISYKKKKLKSKSKSQNYSKNSDSDDNDNSDDNWDGVAFPEKLFNVFNQELAMLHPDSDLSHEKFY